MKLKRAPATLPLTREQFIAQILTITGDTRLFWLPKNIDTTTSTDESLNARVITYDATIAGQFSKVGLGDAVSFDGATDFGSIPDVANLSFGNGTTDSPFSIVAIANVADSAAVRRIVSKYNNITREWRFGITGTDTLFFGFYDESLDVAPFRTSDAVITQGSWRLFGGVYTAATGGATAADDIILYQDGLPIASAPSNSPTYVAMEDTTSTINIGADGSPGSFFVGSMALILVVAKALTASEMWAIYQACSAYFNL